MTEESASLPRIMIAVGTLVTAVGLAGAAIAPVVGTPGSERTGAQQAVGGVIVVVGWLVLAWGIHRFGRES